MSAKNTKTMVFSKSAKVTQINRKISNKTIEQVNSFQYLGATVTEDGRSEKRTLTTNSDCQEEV